MFSRKTRYLLPILLLAVAVLAAGCGQETTDKDGLSGTIAIDGSSTVFPITEAVAEEFQKINRDVRVTVGISGTGGGFKKFSAGETDISGASRPIKDIEKELAEANNIEYIELPIAFDGISVVVSADNDFVDCLTVEELQMIWEPASKVTKWSDIRPEWPNKNINLYAPGTDSGTFDYFTEVINGKGGASRSDFTASEDDNVLVVGVANDKYALGYFGYAYYVENQDRLKVVSIDGGNGCNSPTDITINNGTYSPLSRPIFIYVNTASLQKPEVEEFVRFYLTEGVELIPQVGYIPLPSSYYTQGLEKVDQVVR